MEEFTRTLDIPCTVIVQLSQKSATATEPAGKPEPPAGGTSPGSGAGDVTAQSRFRWWTG